MHYATSDENPLSAEFRVAHGGGVVFEVSDLSLAEFSTLAAAGHESAHPLDQVVDLAVPNQIAQFVVEVAVGGLAAHVAQKIAQVFGGVIVVQDANGPGEVLADAPGVHRVDGARRAGDCHEPG